MNVMEIWKDIEGYEGLYQISNYGRVYSIKREYTGGFGAKCHTGGKMMKIDTNKKRSNRRYVLLCKDGIVSPPQYISVLVAKAFIPNPENKPEVDHIIPIRNGGGDEAWNLRWVTRKENMDNELTKEHLKEVANKKKVEQYTKDGILIKVFDSILEASKCTGVARANIINCCNNKPKYKTAGGSIWKFAA